MAFRYISEVLTSLKYSDDMSPLRVNRFMARSGWYEVFEECFQYSTPSRLEGLLAEHELAEYTRVRQEWAGWHYWFREPADAVTARLLCD